MDTTNKILRFRVDLLGTSEDTKPLNIPNGSTFYEVNWQACVNAGWTTGY